MSFSPEKHADKITSFHTEISTTNFLQDENLEVQIHFSYNTLKQSQHANIIHITRTTV
jgi:hypothetical protein